jgi:hypothetical protein
MLHSTAHILSMIKRTKFTKNNSTIETLIARNYQLECQVEALNRTIADNNNKDATEAAAATFAVDFSTLGAFSVERIIKHGVATTVIGYIVRETIETSNNTEERETSYKTEVREWTLYCNQDRHEELVKEFKKQLVL